MSENEVNAEWLKKLFFIMLSAVHNRKCKAAVLCLSVSPVFFLILMQLWVTSRVMTWWSCFSHFSPCDSRMCCLKCFLFVYFSVWLLGMCREFKSEFECCWNPIILGKSDRFTDLFTSDSDLPFVATSYFLMSGDFLYNIKRRMGPGYVVRFAV